MVWVHPHDAEHAEAPQGVPWLAVYVGCCPARRAGPGPREALGCYPAVPLEGAGGVGHLLGVAKEHHDVGVEGAVAEGSHAEVADVGGHNGVIVDEVPPRRRRCAVDPGLRGLAALRVRPGAPGPGHEVVGDLRQAHVGVPVADRWVWPAADAVEDVCLAPPPGPHHELAVHEPQGSPVDVLLEPGGHQLVGPPGEGDGVTLEPELPYQYLPLLPRGVAQPVTVVDRPVIFAHNSS